MPLGTVGCAYITQEHIEKTAKSFKEYVGQNSDESSFKDLVSSLYTLSGLETKLDKE